MKVLPFTIPVPDDSSIIVQEELLPHFYPHLHRHAEVQITWVIKGEGTLLAGSNMHPFVGGEVFVLGANQPHLFKNSPEYFNEQALLQIHALTIFFDPNGKLSPLFDLPEMKALRLFADGWQSGFIVPAERTAVLTDQMLAIQHASGASQLSMFISMLKDLSSVPEPKMLSPMINNYPLTDPEGLRIASVYNYIMHNFSREITLNEVAALVHLTPNAFCRYFKKHTRTTFVAFVNKVRVNEACKLLVNGGNNNIADVAYNCGFSSITNFNYVFRNTIGKAPRTYASEYAGATKN
jgi:AraC-like DNA-binding protein